MRRLLRIVVPILVLAAGGAAGITLIKTAPEAKRREAPPVLPSVEIMPVQSGSYQVLVRSRGTVAPRTQSTLLPEVAGRVTEITSQFRSGGFFEAGDLLLTIDPLDYENAVTIARAELAQARLALREEEAQSEQALRNWKKLGGGDAEAGDLVLRKPQMASARAAVAAAEARLRRAAADLERTRIRAPYAGRVLNKQVDVGQYVTPGTVLASIYAVDYVEIRLPLTDEQVAFVDLPESYRGEARAPLGPPVTLTARVGGDSYQWQGRIVRTEGAIDTQSRQLFVVAQVDDPYARRTGQPPLKVGQFVSAEIQGQRLDGVMVLPRSAVRGEDQVMLVTPERTVQRRRVEIAWRDTEHVVVSGGLEAGDSVSLTPLPYAPDGSTVKVHGEPRAAADKKARE